MAERADRRARWLGIGTGALLAAALLGLIVRLSGGEGPLPLDAWWRDVVATAPEGALLAMSHGLDTIGGGRLAHLWIPLGLLIVLLALRRPWSALLYAVSSLATTALVQASKAAFARLRPDDIVIDISSAAYPSGHTAFAATVATALWLVLPRWWVAALGVAWTAAMAFSRTHLSAHWLTDTVGGALVGMGVVLVMAAMLSHRLAEEPCPPRR
ncbi:phosphatase PAP2 family protein [Microbacterium sp. Marseille-Q6965]|uniref:phosphatase PAP2 family protein n=1 Tax=Microbacterium sp. Marseille-Q6965 TaxID=2965072 RepID=UPI0021B84C4A|nr:phosphatase PAP2 family protein [Microbacterium sp. Marseille-Q6965]